MVMEYDQLAQLINQQNASFNSAHSFTRGAGQPEPSALERFADSQGSANRANLFNYGAVPQFASSVSNSFGTAFDAYSTAQTFGIGPQALDPFYVPFATGMLGWQHAGKLGMSRLGGAATGFAVGAAPVVAGYTAASYGIDHIVQGVHQQTHAAAMIANNFGNSGINLSPGISTFNQLAGVTNSIAAVTPPGMSHLMDHGSMSNLVGMGMQSGAFRGTDSVGEFRQRLVQLTREAAEVSNILKVSIDESYAAIREISGGTGFSGSQVGGFLSSASNTFGVTGAGIGQQMGFASQGAGLYRSLGQTSMFGAASGLRLGRQIATFANSSLLSNNQLSDLGGVDGILSSFNEASFGVLSSGLGTQALSAAMNDDGTLDMAMARKIATGGVSLQEVQKRARRVSQNKNLARQFQVSRQDMMSQFMSEIGPSGLLGIAGLTGTSDYDLMSNTGMSRRELDALKSFAGSEDDIKAKISDAMSTGLRSGGGGRSIREILDNVATKITQPVKNYFEKIGRGISDAATTYVDDVQRSLSGDGPVMYGGARSVFDRMNRMRSVGAFEEASISFGGMGGGTQLSPFRPGSETSVGQFIESVTPYGIQHIRNGGDVGNLDPMQFIGGASNAGSTLRGLSLLEMTSGRGTLNGIGYLMGGNLYNAEKLAYGVGNSVRGMVNPLLPSGMRVAERELMFLGSRNMVRAIGLGGGTAVRGASLGLRSMGRLAGGPLGMIGLELALRTDDMLAATGAGTRDDGIGGGLSEFLAEQQRSGRDYDGNIIGSSNPSLADANGFVPINDQEMNTDVALEGLKANKWTGWLTSRVYRGISNYTNSPVTEQMYLRNRGAALQNVMSIASLGDSTDLRKTLGLSSTAFGSKARSFQSEVDQSLWDGSTLGGDLGQRRRLAQMQVAKKMFGVDLSPQELDKLGFAGGDSSLVAAQSKADELLGRSFYVDGMSQKDFDATVKGKVGEGLDSIIGRFKDSEQSKIDAQTARNLRGGESKYSMIPMSTNRRDSIYGDDVSGRVIRNDASALLADRMRDDLGRSLDGMGSMKDYLATTLTESVDSVDPQERVLLAKGDKAALARFVKKLRSNVGTTDGDKMAALTRFTSSEDFGGVVSSVFGSGLDKARYEEYSKRNLERFTSYSKAATTAGSFSDNFGMFAGGQGVSDSLQSMMTARSQSEDGFEERAAAFQKMSAMSPDDLYKLSAHYSEAFHRTGDGTMNEVSALAGMMGQFKSKTKDYLGKKGMNEKGRRANFSALVGDDSELMSILEKGGSLKSGSIDESTHWKLQAAVTQRLRLDYGDSAPQMADRVMRGIGGIFDKDGLTSSDLGGDGVGKDIRSAMQLRGSLASGRGATTDKGDLVNQKFADTIDTITTKLSGLGTSLDAFGAKINGVSAADGGGSATPDNAGKGSGIMSFFGLGN